jgi:hypothetical protein
MLIQAVQRQDITDFRTLGCFDDYFLLRNVCVFADDGQLFETPLLFKQLMKQHITKFYAKLADVSDKLDCTSL